VQPRESKWYHHLVRQNYKTNCDQHLDNGEAPKGVIGSVGIEIEEEQARIYKDADGHGKDENTLFGISEFLSRNSIRK